MLNKLKITSTLLAATILPLCARPSRAQHWNDEEARQSREAECDTGFYWDTWDTKPLKLKTGPEGEGNALDHWTMTGGDPQLIQPILDVGVSLPLKSGTEPTYLAYQTDDRWMRPMYVKMRFQSTGAPGILSTFNFTEAGQTQKAEVHFMAGSLKTGNDKVPLMHYLSIPHLTPAENGGFRSLTTGGDNAEVRIQLAGGTTYANDIFNSENVDDFDGDEGPKRDGFQQNWGITWAGFNATSNENVYGFKLLEGRTEWYAGNNWTDIPLRMTVMEETTNDIYPRGPLALSLGPSLSTEDWAGAADWTMYPEPTMQFFELVVSGCKEISF